MLLNDHGACTSTLAPPTVDGNSPSSPADLTLNFDLAVTPCDLALTSMGALPAVDQRKQAKWTRRRGGEWSLRAGMFVTSCAINRR